jgi:hypothetical protein
MATVNKVALANGTVLIDLTSDTVKAESVLAGVTAHDKSGAKITGTLFSNFQDSMELTDSITDSSGNAVMDSSGSRITGIRKYKMV